MDRGSGRREGLHQYAFEKPNDKRALDLMNSAAEAVVTEMPEIVIAYGVSDEFSFVLHKTCALFERRASKLVSTIVSTFTAYYIHKWPVYFSGTPLSPPLPSFDGRAVCYPSVQNLRDYMSWRQIDCHINNLYNTAFWALIQLGGMDPKAAAKRLSGTVSAEKNEVLFGEFQINYNNEPEFFKKGSVVFRQYELVEPGHAAVSRQVENIAESIEQSRTQAHKEKKKRAKTRVVVEHVDIIKDDFWDRRPWILSGQAGKVPEEP